ncbi:MAG: hypothetical protein ACEPOW_13480 [Bacteroidales bacterium]
MKRALYLIGFCCLLVLSACNKTNDPPPPKVAIISIKALINNKARTDVSFTVFDDNNKTAGRKMGDKNGCATFENFPLGNYSIKGERTLRVIDDDNSKKYVLFSAQENIDLQEGFNEITLHLERVP